ncbi:MAG: 4Fe-4S binding protein [Spirochaetes bacterium]|nr:4Fe-4S binding protein [Spirochaetota bacterium]
MKQIVVISGKGGTGKTTLTACFAALSKNKIICDCDVDAADLYLLLGPDIMHEENFTGSKVALIDPEKCSECGECVKACRFDAIIDLEIDPVKCEGCGVCVYLCPEKAIVMNNRVDGTIFLSDTSYGPFFYARLNAGSGNSGKLVTEIRKKAFQKASDMKSELILIDGSPGIGCPVIASISGTDLALIVIEPTLSGEHDLLRIAGLTEHFKIPTLVCINKFDINEDISNKIENICNEKKIPVVGKIPYDPIVTRAMIEKKTVIEFTDRPVKEQIQNIWKNIYEKLSG